MSVSAPLICPYCLTPNEVASALDDDPLFDIIGPKPGDMSICAECIRVSCVTDTGYSLRMLTPEEAELVAQQEDIQATRMTLLLSRATIIVIEPEP